MPVRVTIAEVALRAGVSKAAAHRALTHGREVHPEKRARILAAAEALGYRPDPALSMLARQRWQLTGPAKSLTLAAVYYQPPRKVQPRVNQIEALITQAHAEGYDLRRFNTADFPSGAALTRRLVNEGINGVVVIASAHPEARFDLDWNLFSAVVLGAGPSPPPLPVVRFNYYESTLESLRRLRALGFRRIGAAFRRDAVPTPDDDRRRAALYLFQKGLGPDEQALPPLDAPFNQPQPVVDWFRRHRPDAVLAFSVAEYFFLKSAGLLPAPGAGFAALTVQQHHLNISGMLQEFDHLARAVVMKLDNLIRFNQRGATEPIEHTVLNTRWNEGTTLGEAVRSEE